MTNERHKPKPGRIAEIPGGGAEMVAQLHGKIQEARDATRDLRALLGAADTLASRLEALADRISEATSEDVIKARLDSLLSADAIWTRFEPAVDEVTDKMLRLGDLAKQVLQDRETELVGHITAAFGTADKDDFVKMVAGLVIADVLDAVTELRAAQEAKAEISRKISAQLADLPSVVSGLSVPPVPPKAKRQQSRAQSHNQHRRH